MALKFMGGSGMPGIDSSALFAQPKEQDFCSSREDYTLMSKFDNDMTVDKGIQSFQMGEIGEESKMTTPYKSPRGDKL